MKLCHVVLAMLAGVAALALVGCSGEDPTEAVLKQASKASVSTTTVTSTTTSSSTTTTSTTTPPATSVVPDGPGDEPEGDGGGLPYYRDCDAADAADASPIYEGEPGYRRELDRDNDGIACETGEPPGSEQKPSSTPTVFTSPSGNIACALDEDYVRCDIRDRSWAPPPAPGWCEFDWGEGVQLTAGGAAEYLCASDTVLGGTTAVLAYGESTQPGAIRCTSSSSGMTCEDVSTGRGFTLSRASAALK